MNYDPRNPFVLCCQSLTPIYQGSPSSQCPFCQASYQPKFDGTTCAVCNLSVVGRRVAGIHCVQKDAKPRAAQRESARDSDGW
jgi:coatomer protein complex subunit alpha (xenin)